MGDRSAKSGTELSGIFYAVAEHTTSIQYTGFSTTMLGGAVMEWRCQARRVSIRPYANAIALGSEIRNAPNAGIATDRGILNSD